MTEKEGVSQSLIRVEYHGCCVSLAHILPGTLVFAFGFPHTNADPNSNSTVNIVVNGKQKL